MTTPPPDASPEGPRLPSAAASPQSEAERSALLASIVDSIEDAVISVDASGSITSWNLAAERLYGYSAGEAVGAPLSMLLPGAPDAVAFLARAVAEDHVAYTEAERVRKDRALVRVGETVSPMHRPDGQTGAVAIIARDIGQRLDAEAALAAVQRELEERNRRLERSNAELEQFAYVASHDLSEPLRAVSGMITLLERRYKDRLDEDANEFIAFAVEGCVRMRDMIEDLLAFSRIGRAELQIETVDLERVVNVVTSMLSNQIEQTGAVVETGDLPDVRGDRQQLTQLLQNLISNAIKFSQPGVPPVVRISGTRVGAAWRVDVADNGLGIEEQYRARIFKMFQRLHTRDAYPGTGIGLAIAARIVERHGGTMTVSSNSPAGSIFSFVLPDSPEEATQ